jgi:hypothetical protein
MIVFYIKVSEMYRYIITLKFLEISSCCYFKIKDLQNTYTNFTLTNGNKDQQSKATVIERNPRHNQAKSAGQPRDIASYISSNIYFSFKC